LDGFFISWSDGAATGSRVHNVIEIGASQGRLDATRLMLMKEIFITARNVP
jgi:hypothetical protein